MRNAEILPIPTRRRSSKRTVRSDADATTEWLLAGDPSIRWQVMRDLLGAPTSQWSKERERVGHTGWGARLLAQQRPDGHWGRGVYHPKWTCTTYTLQLLRQLGLPPGHPAVLEACRRYLEEGLDEDGGINFWRPRRPNSETCITGMVLAQLCAFRLEDERVEGVVDYLLREQMPDGGWNCMRAEGARHSSFHTTISVLEALREYALAGGRRRRQTEQAEVRCQEFLLQHRLFKSSTTGRVVSGDMTRFHFPPYWHYDVLRALDSLQVAHARRDERAEDAIELLRSRQQPDGRWSLARSYPGAVHFELEPAGQPSRWNTLRALRVLAWWETSNRSHLRRR